VSALARSARAFPAALSPSFMPITIDSTASAAVSFNFNLAFSVASNAVASGDANNAESERSALRTMNSTKSAVLYFNDLEPD
jgi:hypothetical protein